MKLILFFTFLIFSFSICFSQENNTVQKRESYRKLKKRKSNEQILELKNGTLLIRLKTSENKINALISSGKKQIADIVKLKQDVENKAIIYAFKNNFKFCKVAYFLSNNSNNIKNNNFNNVFINDSLFIDNTITIDTSKCIYIAEFGSIEQDTMKYFSNYYYKQVDKNLVKTERYNSSSTDINIYALIIKDNNFLQLNKPFPFYSRAIYKTIEERPEQTIIIPFAIYAATLTKSYSKTVQKMNSKLSKFYNKQIK